MHGVSYRSCTCPESLASFRRHTTEFVSKPHFPGCGRFTALKTGPHTPACLTIARGTCGRTPVCSSSRVTSRPSPTGRVGSAPLAVAPPRAKAGGDWAAGAVAASVNSANTCTAACHLGPFVPPPPHRTWPPANHPYNEQHIQKHTPVKRTLRDTLSGPRLQTRADILDRVQGPSPGPLTVTAVAAQAWLAGGHWSTQHSTARHGRQQRTCTGWPCAWSSSLSDSAGMDVTYDDARDWRAWPHADAVDRRAGCGSTCEPRPRHSWAAARSARSVPRSAARPAAMMSSAAAGKKSRADVVSESARGTGEQL